MEEIINQINELCLDLFDELRIETDTASKSLLITQHIKTVQKLHEQSSKENALQKFWCETLEFKTGLDWMNVIEPLTLKQHLKGKLVLLDFFTYCCINCMHILPDLKKLEHDYTVEDGLVVIGVHSAKFTNEKHINNVKAAVDRYEISHPVVNDTSGAMWTTLGVMCWPTLYILGPNSEPLMLVQGEGHYDFLKLFIFEALKNYKQSGLLSHQPIPQISQHVNLSSSKILYYPGKICVDSFNKIIAISDTANHRILTVSEAGEILDEIGGLDSGMTDGTYKVAKFFSPQGVIFKDNFLYIADTENHTIREINLASKIVKTLVGTGKQGHDYKGGMAGLTQTISSPWDVCIVNDILLIAMAGTHQIWGYFFKDTTLWKKNYVKGTCCALVGSGREENRNNQYPMSCGLAQPSGLSYDSSGYVYIADSESSTIRCLSMETGSVTMLVGGSIDPRNLFSFGDKDGIGLEAKLQHPLGVGWSSFDDCIYVADTYNHKIKKVNKSSKQSITVNTNDIKLSEPGGLFAFDDRVYIVDTNNHCIRFLQLPQTTLHNFDIMYKTKSGIKDKVTDIFTTSINSKGGTLTIDTSIILPPDVKLTKEAPSKWSLHLPGHSVQGAEGNFELATKWKIPITRSDFLTEKEISVKSHLFLCKGDVCIVKELCFIIILCFDDNASCNPECCINCTLSTF